MTFDLGPLTMVLGAGEQICMVFKCVLMLHLYFHVFLRRGEALGDAWWILGGETSPTGHLGGAIGQV